MVVRAGRGDSTARAGTGETSQGHRAADRAARVVRGKSTQTSPGSHRRTQRSARTAQQASQQVCIVVVVALVVVIVVLVVVVVVVAQWLSG